MRGVLVDTSFWYSLFDRMDSRNADALRISREQTLRLLITRPCLVELVTMLSSHATPQQAALVWEGMEDGRYGMIVEILREDEVEGRRLLRRFAERRLSYADATACALVRRLDIPRVLTFDSDFKIVLPEREVVGPA